MRILVNAVNAVGGMGAERALSAGGGHVPTRMRAEGVPLFCLEELRAAAAEFDAVGITLPHELAATNVLETLDLAGIPLRTADRAEGDPIVLAGGPCAYNPEPYAPFFDVILVGEGEEQPARGAGAHPQLRASGAAPGRYPARGWRGAWGAPTCRACTAGAARTRPRLPQARVEPLFDDVPRVVHKRVFEGFADSPALGAHDRALYGSGARPAERRDPARLRAGAAVSVRRA